jgi:hypothetical protein
MWPHVTVLTVYTCGLLQAKVALLELRVKNETPLIIPNFNCFWTQTSYLQDSNCNQGISFHHFDWKNIFKDNAVKKSVRMGQSLMIINFFSTKDFINCFIIFWNQN